MEKDIEERFDRIENMLKHMHDHIEIIDGKTWVIREGFEVVAQEIGCAIEDLQKGEEFYGKGDRIGSNVHSSISSLMEDIEDSYTPIDEEDKVRQDKKDEIRRKEQFKKLEKEVEREKLKHPNLK